MAYPREHRREYGELMVQLFRDRMRCEGGGLRSLVIWMQTLTDLVGSALRERMEGVEMRATLMSTFWTVFEPRIRWWYLVITIALVALIAFGLSGLPREANYRYEAGVLPGSSSLEAILAERAAEAGFTAEAVRQQREWYEEYRLQTVRLYSKLHAPDSIQLVAQMMVTAGALFAVSLGVISGRAARSSARQGTARAANSGRRWVLAPYFAVPILLWIPLTGVAVVLGLVGGFIIPPLLSMKGPVVGNSTWNLALAVMGILLAGFMWSAIGVGLGTFIRSAPIAFAVGISAAMCEVSFGFLADGFQHKLPLPFAIPVLLPTHGAISLVSIDAPKLFHGLVTPTFGLPLNGPSSVAGAVLLLGAWASAVGIGLRHSARSALWGTHRDEARGLL